jgi:hypothetical protein
MRGKQVGKPSGFHIPSHALRFATRPRLSPPGMQTCKWLDVPQGIVASFVSVTKTLTWKQAVVENLCLPYSKKEFSRKRLMLLMGWSRDFGDTL